MRTDSDAFTRSIVRGTRKGNGKTLLPDGVDGRSAMARRYSELVRAFGRRVPGADAAQRALIERCAGMVLLCEAMEKATIQGRASEYDSNDARQRARLMREMAAYSKLVSQLTKTMQALGFRVAEPPEDGDGLQSYLMRAYGLSREIPELRPEVPTDRKVELDDDGDDDDEDGGDDEDEDEDEAPPRRQAKRATGRVRRRRWRSGDAGDETED
jgi:hypothetical protein